MLFSCRPEERKNTSSNIYVYTQMPPPRTHTHAHTQTLPFFTRAHLINYHPKINRTANKNVPIPPLIS